MFWSIVNFGMILTTDFSLYPGVFYGFPVQTSKSASSL